MFDGGSVMDVAISMQNKEDKEVEKWEERMLSREETRIKREKKRAKKGKKRKKRAKEQAELIKMLARVFDMSPDEFESFINHAKWPDIYAAPEYR